jgi:hypothetical protein
MASATTTAHQLERLLKEFLRNVPSDELSQAEKQTVQQIRLACHEIKLDVRDYTYAQTRAEQLKWAELGRHNLAVLHALLLSLDAVFSPADIAQFGAYVDELSSSLQ